MRIRRPTVHDASRHPRLYTTLVLAALLVISVGALAQQPAPMLQQDLQRIGEEASALQQSLPSFACEETATSQAIHDHKTYRTVHVEGNLRMVRQPDGRLKETYEFKRDHILFIPTNNMPAYVSGGFDSALNYFLPSAQGCYRYTLSSPSRINFQTRDDAATPAACKDRGLKGFALLGPEGHVTHIERTIPLDVAKSLKLATYASIDLAPIELNGHTFDLSNHMIAEMPIPLGSTGRIEATYSHCRLFTTTVTIGPASEVPTGAMPNPK